MRSATLLGLIAIGSAGCGRPQSVVSGMVSIDDRPIERGHVTFFPRQGTKGARGVEIKGGRYQATDLAPGSWRVQVAETPQVEVVQRPGEPPVLKFDNGPSLQRAPPSVVEIRPGKQTLDLALPGR